jgi:hypothetical protein
MSHKPLRIVRDYKPDAERCDRALRAVVAESEKPCVTNVTQENGDRAGKRGRRDGKP